VLAYTVLSAGIFSSERGKEAVYSGLNAAQSTMAVKGSVIGTSLAVKATTTLTFTLALAIPGSSVDLSKLVFNYYDSKANFITGIDSANIAFTEGGVTATILSGSGQILVVVDLGTEGLTTQLAAYDTFTLEIIPPTGATINIQRTLPGDIGTLATDIRSLN
jgi:flagellin FlaB